LRLAEAWAALALTRPNARAPWCSERSLRSSSFPPVTARCPMPSEIHRALIVDPVVLRELEGLLAVALSTGDGTALRDFERSRRAAYARLRDARQTWLDPAVLVKALADIGALARSPLRKTPKGERLLALSRTFATRARYVGKDAYQCLPTRAARLRKLINLQAPDTFLENEVRMVLDALDALDQFDFAVRSMGDGVGRLHDHELADACLCRTYVAGTEPIGTGDTRLSRRFVEGPEVFPRPTGLHDLASWMRFCGSLAGKPPRIAVGYEIVETVRRIESSWRQVAEDPARTAEERTQIGKALIRYAKGLNRARMEGNAVVEWLVYDEDAEEYLARKRKKGLR